MSELRYELSCELICESNRGKCACLRDIRIVVSVSVCVDSMLPASSLSAMNEGRLAI